MDIRPLSLRYAVAPQITSADLPKLAAAGFTHIICNRPAFESAPDDAPDHIAAATEAAGLKFIDNPVVGGQLTMEIIETQSSALSGKVLAYCASGTRSAIVWGLAQAGKMPTDDILSAMAEAGYPMEQMRPQIDAVAAQVGKSS